jgi:hypothetical protein
MSGIWRSIWSTASGWRPTALVACAALASTAVVCMSLAAHAASAAVTTTAPAARPSVGTVSSAAGTIIRSSTATTAPGTTKPAIPSNTATATAPPATVYTGPANPSLLKSNTLGRTGAAAPASRHAAKSGTSMLAIVIAALGALLVLACAAWALARRRAYEPHWWLSLQHSLGEAGYRTSSTWAEFSDWARRGG